MRHEYSSLTLLWLCVIPMQSTDPVYCAFEAALIGTGGLNALGVGEAAARTRWEVSTDI